MLSMPIIFFLVLIGHSVYSQSPLWSNFETVPLKQATMYSLLRRYGSSSQALLKFPATNTSADYTTPYWMDPCYEEFFTNEKNTYVVFWIFADGVYCEAVSVIADPKDPRFPMVNLMRVERLGDRCAS